MRVITEVELREKYKKSQFSTFHLPQGCRLTPAAAQFLSERKIQVITDENSKLELKVQENEAKDNEKTQNQHQTENLKTEKKEVAKKPEHMTHLRGKTLVAKNHPRIKFRGKVDTLEALLISTIIDVEKLGLSDLARDLREFLQYVANMMRAEVMEETLPPLSIRSWSEKEIREISHNPQRYFGIKHFMPKPEHGKLIAQLNYIRTQCRELEVAALDAFYSSDGKVERKDILQAVNRFSSLLYVMMVGLMSGHYKVGC
jgi:ethanolamine utilization cobalamin adenosyltransferase